ncbi:MAG: porphobilinogen synthase [Verrucomicrobiae bacterium]|nr:porphobilinogen synthase [Verrucomicrobiae bacterium]
MTNTIFNSFRRPRRLRHHASVRDIIQETHLRVEDFIAPLFVKEIEKPEPVTSMPDVFRFNPDDLIKECASLHQLGIRAVALFPCLPLTQKDPQGSKALDPEGLLLKTVRKIKKELPQLLIITDVALDPYTNHGHDGVLEADGQDVDNDITVEKLTKMAVLQAEAGVDFVAPSDMMDGRVQAIRQALDQKGFFKTGILAYSIKFASAFYGPFRDAVGSKQAAGTASLDKRTYQLNPANTREALLEGELDEQEGADILMVKPAGPYLDLIAKLREKTFLPIAAYQVSGEYAQLHAAAQQGWLDLEKTRHESLLAIKRAGADMIFTYFAKDMAKILQKK